MASKAEGKLGNDPRTYGLLALERLRAGDLTEAWRVAEEGWQRFGTFQGDPGQGASLVRLAVARAQLRLMRGDFQGVLEAVQRCVGMGGSHAELDFLAGVAWETQARGVRDPVHRERLAEAAIDAYRRCVGSNAKGGRDDPAAAIAGATSWAGWTRMGTAYLIARQPEEAGLAFDKAIALQPDCAPALVGRAESALARGDAATALELSLGLLSHTGLRDRPDYWVLGAAVAEEFGSLDDMAKMLEGARARLSSRYVAPHLGDRHAELVVAMAAYRATPMGGPGLVGALGALLARAPVAPRDVGAWTSDPRVVGRFLRNLASSGRLDRIEPLLEPRAEVLAPGLTKHVREAVARLGVHLEWSPPPTDVAVRGPSRDLVAAMLDAHQALRGHVRTVADDAAVTGARVVDVVERGTSDARADAVATVRLDGLLGSPAEHCDRLLALLGQGDARALVRFVVDRYPQVRDACAMPAATRAEELR